jgi:hypothetical protein
VILEGLPSPEKRGGREKIKEKIARFLYLILNFLSMNIKG